MKKISAFMEKKNDDAYLICCQIINTEKDVLKLNGGHDIRFTPEQLNAKEEQRNRLRGKADDMALVEGVQK